MEQNLTESDNEKDIIAGVLRLALDKDYVDNVLRAIAYPQFDAVAMRKKICPVLVRARNLQALQNLYNLCLIGLRLGNNLEWISKAIKDEFRSVFMMLKLKLKLVSRAAGNVDAVTLQRVISCFPEVAVAVLDTPRCVMAIPYETLTAIAEEFPLVARHQVCASIIDTTLPRDQLAKIMDVIMVPYMLMSNLVNRRNKDWNSKDDKTRFFDNFGYLRKSFESKVLSVPARRKACIVFKIINEDGNMTATWEVASGKCKEWLIKNYGCSSSDKIGSWSVDGSDL